MKSILTKITIIPKNTVNYFKENKKPILSSLAFIVAMMTLTSYADFWTEAVDGASKFVKAIGVGLGIWGLINLAEGYGNDNPAAKNQGIKQLAAGGAIFFLAPKLLETLKGVFS